MRAIALLSLWKVKNTLRTTLSDPRKIGPLIFFSVCMGISLVLFGVGLSENPGGEVTGRTLNSETLRAATTFSMILLGLAVIDGGLGDNLLAFAMPDVDYLFPSPISRRTVLAYKLPALTFGSVFFGGFVLVLFTALTKFAHAEESVVGHAYAAGWVAPLALFCSVGIYLNLAMWISVRILNRSKLHIWLLACFTLFGIGLALIWWIQGSRSVVSILQSSWLRTLFRPSSLASDVLVAGFCHQDATTPLCDLLIGYAASFVPMFLANSNWYEQSIVSSERVSRFRQAAKGGFSAIMAAKSTTFRHKAAREYTVPRFGTGAMALYWAHLCASAKRPYSNFVAPFVGGVALGALGAAANTNSSEIEGIGFGFLAGLAAYATMAFMQIARTASEGAIRRRELLSPLPISGWQSVAANLAVPIMAFLMFCLGATSGYCIPNAPLSGVVGFAFCVLLPLRTAARMVLQYVIVLGYPDLADKLQQVLSVGVYMVLTTPFLLVEILFCMPALLFQSIWLGLITLSLLQIPFIAFLLLIAGIGAERAVATGEPINLFQIFRMRKQA